MNKKQKYLRGNKGITLIALVVTIIVLIILAGISINLILGDNGIITKAAQAKEKNTHTTVYESLLLEVQTFSIDKEAGKTNKTMVEYLMDRGIIAQSSLNEKEYILNVKKLCGKELEYGNGTDEQTDVYKLLETVTVAKLVSTELVKLADTGSSEKTYTLVYSGEDEGETLSIGKVYVELDVTQEEQPGQNQLTLTLQVEQTENYGELNATVTEQNSQMPANATYKYYIRYAEESGYSSEYPTEPTYQGSEASYLFTGLATNSMQKSLYDVKVVVTDSSNNEIILEQKSVQPKIVIRDL